MPMAPEKYEAVETLDSDELSFVRRLFKNGDVKSDGRISVAEVVACVEKMEYIVDEPLADIARAVVPAAVEVDRLSLNDAIKVASAAKAQDKGSAAPPVPGVGREDSLAQLESSFIKQVMSGEIAVDDIDDIVEEEPTVPSPGLGREDSLAQLESSFKDQVLSGSIPPAIVEAPEGSANVPPPNVVAVSVDIPKRRRSVAGGYPSSPSNTARGQVKRGGSLSAMAGPEPVVVDDVPKRRSSVARPGGGSLAGLQADDDDSTMPASPELMKGSSEMQLLESAGTLSVEPVEASSVPKKRRSFAVSESWLEAAAQESAKALEVKKRGEAQQAEAQRQKAESEKARAEVEACLLRLTDQVEHSAEIARAKEEAEKRERAAALKVQRAEAAAARTEVETALRLLVESLEQDAAVAKTREEAERLVQKEAEARQAAEVKAAEAAERAEEAARAREEEDRVQEEARRALQVEAELLRSKLQEAGEEAAERAQEEARAKEEAEKRERAAALEMERAEATAARTEVETALRLLMESLERDAAVAKTREEAERLVQKEAEARQAAEIMAAEAAQRAEEAARAREEEDRVREEARRALQAEAELLRSKLQEAGEEAADRAQEEAQARADKEAQELRQAEEQAEKEARLVEEAKRAAEREAEIKEAADRDSKSWEEKFEALQREREEEAQRAKEELARAVEEAKEFERAKELALRAAEERHPLEGANVSYDDVNSREGKSWWRCLSCTPDESSDVKVGSRPASSKSIYDNEDDAAVSGLKPELWIKSDGATVSTKSVDRPGKADVCSIS